MGSKAETGIGQAPECPGGNVGEGQHGPGSSPGTGTLGQWKLDFASHLWSPDTPNWSLDPAVTATHICKLGLNLSLQRDHPEVLLIQSRRRALSKAAGCCKPRPGFEITNRKDPGSQSRRCQGFLGISGKLPPSSCPCAASRSFIRSCSRIASCSFGVFPQPTLQSADRSFEKSEAGILTWIWSLSIRGHVLRVIQAAVETQAGRSSLVLAKPPELKSKSPLTGQELLQSS